MTFSIYAVPAILAFLTKVGIFFYQRGSSLRSTRARLFLLFLLSFALLNAVEIAFFMRIGESGIRPPGALGRLWFSAAAVAVAVLLHFALLAAVEKKVNGVRSEGASLFYLPTAALLALLWKGPLLIVDFEPMAYTFTKVPGPLYFLWEAYVVIYLASTAVLLLHGAFRRGPAYRRLQNRLLLTGFVPLVVLSLSIIGLQRFGYRGFNATATLPFTTTFLLIVAAYAVHQFRLLDVAFYVPWSKSRKHKTDLYSRLERTTREISQLESPWDVLERIANELRCRVALLGGPQPLSASPRLREGSGESGLLAEFPGEALEKIDRTITADEIAHSDPELHELMTRYRVGAIVPFRTHRTIPGYCLLLGEQFNEEIYSSLDFKVADRLFSAMAQRFFEDFLLVRSQLQHMQDQLHGTRRNLMRAEQDLAGVRVKLTAARKQNRALRDELAQLRRANFRLVKREPTDDETQTKALGAYLAEREREAVRAALARAGGNQADAARLLGIPLHVLLRLMERHGLRQADEHDS